MHSSPLLKSPPKIAVHRGFHLFADNSMMAIVTSVHKGFIVEIDINYVRKNWYVLHDHPGHKKVVHAERLRDVLEVVSRFKNPRIILDIKWSSKHNTINQIDNAIERLRHIFAAFGGMQNVLLQTESTEILHILQCKINLPVGLLMPDPDNVLIDTQPAFVTVDMKKTLDHHYEKFHSDGLAIIVYNCNTMHEYKELANKPFIKKISIVVCDIYWI